MPPIDIPAIQSGYLVFGKRFINSSLICPEPCHPAAPEQYLGNGGMLPVTVGRRCEPARRPSRISCVTIADALRYRRK
jgi:hypothetical protein